MKKWRRTGEWKWNICVKGMRSHLSGMLGMHWFYFAASIFASLPILVTSNEHLSSHVIKYSRKWLQNERTRWRPGCLHSECNGNWSHTFLCTSLGFAWHGSFSAYHEPIQPHYIDANIAYECLPRLHHYNFQLFTSGALDGPKPNCKPDSML